MLPDSTQQLILKLWDLTARGVIPWSAGDDDEHHFETEGYVVAITADPPRVRILRPNGHTVEETNSAALSATGWPHPDFARFDAAVSELAHRAAKFSSGKTKPTRAAMTALTAPARPTSQRLRRKEMFGAIKSFDVSGERAGKPTSLPAEPEKNVYSPWIT